MSFERVCENVYLLRVPHGGTTTGVVLLTGDKNYLIDAAGNSEEVDEYIIPALSELSLDISDIECVVPTHTHGDHIGGFKRLKELGIREIVAYELSVPKIIEPLKYNIEIRQAFPKNSPPPSSGLEGTSVDRILKDGDVIDGRVEIIATPGHDSDTVCIYDRLTKALVCGDSIQLNGTLVQGCGAYMYLPEYRASMEKLISLDAECAVLGHPFLPVGDIARGREEVRKLLKDALDLTYSYRGFVKSELDKGESDLLKIAEKLVKHIDGVMPTHMFLPLYTVREHVSELKK
ncbi:MAG: MBL fold metallo-hydrolase [Clostridia bacterium]|nr:MBL fold metallo-hydrolase [Clostridia bacterium]